MTVRRPLVLTAGNASELPSADRLPNACVQGYTPVSPEMYGAVGDGVTDDTAAITAMLAANRVGWLTPGKTYAIVSAAIRIPSNTTLIAYGATVIRAGAIDNLLHNDADGVTGGTGANSNITILGGTWDGAYSTYPTTACTLLAFGHCSHITIRDATLQNTTIDHLIEVNACYDVLVAYCRFYGGAEQELSTMEALQIDAAISSAVFPWFGPYDNTPCTDITVSHCRFYSCGSGVGTHTDPAAQHVGITVDTCYFTDTFYAAIRAQGWSGILVDHCRIDGGYHGILVAPAASFSLNNVRISNNTVENVGNSTYVGSQGRPISLGSVSGKVVNIATVVGNIVRNCTGDAQHGIFLNGTQKFTVTGNEVDSVNGNGIYCNGGSFGTIVSNHSTLAGDSSFRVDSSSTDINVCHNRGATLAVSGSTKILAKDNILATSVTFTSVTSSQTTPNLVNGSVV